jgi:sugar phosphate isomerase/epimerase
VNFRELRQALDEHGYRGCATVEQDSDPRTGALPGEDTVASLAFLQRIGIVDSQSPVAAEQI